MSHAQVSAMFSAEDHPRAPAGSSAGGQFAKSDGSSSSKPPAKKAAPAKTSPKRKGRTRRDIPKGQLGFDGVSGTGYGVEGGDKRVRALQEELNRLGLTDSRGRKLRVDGELGPLTTQAVKAAQRRLGMKLTGIIAPAFIDRLRATKAMPKPVKKAPARKASAKRARKSVYAKFDPTQKRDDHGRWSTGRAAAEALAALFDNPLEHHADYGDGGYVAEHGDGSVTIGKPGGGLAAYVVDDDLDDLSFALESATDGIRDGESGKAEGGGWELAWGPDGAVLSGDDENDQPVETRLSRDDVISMADALESVRQGSSGAGGDGLPDRYANLDEDSAEHLADLLEGAALNPGEPDPDPSTDDDAGYTLTELGGGGVRLTWADGTVDEFSREQVAALSKLLRGSLDEVTAAASPVTAAELRGIELARPGKWKLASGPMTVTKQHLIDAARYAQRKAARPGYVKIGHNDPRFAPGDGEPALGWVHNVRYAEDERGPKLVGDIQDMPDWLAAAAPTAWPDRSIEGWADFTDEDGEKYALVVDGVALLGVTPPGMSSIQSLRDLPKAVGVAAASGVRVVASMSPALEAGCPTNKEADHMNVDPVKFREALGLPASASDDEVRSALSVTDYASESPPDAAPVQASLFGDEKPAPPAPKNPVTVPGTVVIASSIWDETQKTIKALTDFVAKTKRDERDEYIAKAVQAGKFTPAQRQTFMQLWDENPEYAKKAIDALVPNSALAVLASGYAGGVEVQEDELDREIARLSAPKGALRG